MDKIYEYLMIALGFLMLLGLVGGCTNYLLKTAAKPSDLVSVVNASYESTFQATVSAIQQKGYIASLVDRASGTINTDWKNETSIFPGDFARDRVSFRMLEEPASTVQTSFPI